MVENNCSFAEHVADFREKLELTLKQLAAELGVGFATVNRWEIRKRNLCNLRDKGTLNSAKGSLIQILR